MEEFDILSVLKEAEKNDSWFFEHFLELEKDCAGKLIAIKDQKIVAVADTTEELLEKLKETDFRRVLVIAVPSEEFASIL